MLALLMVVLLCIRNLQIPALCPRRCSRKKSNLTDILWLRVWG